MVIFASFCLLPWTSNFHSVQRNKQTNEWTNKQTNWWKVLTAFAFVFNDGLAETHTGGRLRTRNFPSVEVTSLYGVQLHICREIHDLYLDREILPLCPKVLQVADPSLSYFANCKILACWSIYGCCMYRWLREIEVAWDRGCVGSRLPLCPPCLWPISAEEKGELLMLLNALVLLQDIPWHQHCIILILSVSVRHFNANELLHTKPLAHVCVVY